MRTAISLLCIFLTGQLADAQADPWRHWRLSRLQPGRHVTVHAFQPERVLKGVFIGRDTDGIAIALKSGTIETIARNDIRKLTIRREAYDRAPLLGAGIGGGAFAVIVGANKRRWDFTGAAVAVSALIGAGIGAAIGLAVRAGGRNEVIYEAPRAAPAGRSRTPRAGRSGTLLA
jgi:hypothetical protein